MQDSIKFNAIKLRKQGLLISEIADRLQVPKSTLHYWTKGLELTDRQKMLITGRLQQAKRQHVQGLAERKLMRQRQKEQAIQLQAKTIVANARLSLDHKRLLCAALFWCEGEKDVSSGIRFINSDPLMIKKFLALLRESFVLDESKFRALVHLHSYHDPVVQLRYWSELTNIPETQFYKPYQKLHTSKQTKVGYQGCISVRYVDAALGKFLKAIFVEYSETI
jgi:transposase-like protein